MLGLLAALKQQETKNTQANARVAVPVPHIISNVPGGSVPFHGSFPLSLRKIVPGMSQKKSELYDEVKADINKDSVGGMNMAASFFQNQPNQMGNFPVFQPQLQISPQPKNTMYLVNNPVATIGGKEKGTNLISEATAAGNQVNTADQAASYFDEALTSRNPETEDQHEADELTGSLTSKFSTAPDPDTRQELVTNDFTPEVEISGKIPKQTSFVAQDDISDNSARTGKAMSRAHIQSNKGNKGNSIPATSLQHMSDKSSASNLPPLNHAELPPLNEGTENAGNLPPLNHGMETGALPPLNHGNTAAANLPPLNHGIEISSLPPLNYGEDVATNLPPLIHGIKAETLLPLNHGLEEASNLPPLLKGVEQADSLPMINQGKDALQNFRENPSFMQANEIAANTPIKNIGNLQSFYFKPQNAEQSDIGSGFSSEMENKHIVANLKGQISDLIDSEREKLSASTLYQPSKELQTSSLSNGVVNNFQNSPHFFKTSNNLYSNSEAGTNLAESAVRKSTFYGARNKAPSVPSNLFSQSRSSEQPQSPLFYGGVENNFANGQVPSKDYSSLVSSQGLQRSGAMNTSMYGTNSTVSSVPSNLFSQIQPSQQPQSLPFYSGVANNVANVQASNNYYSSLVSSQSLQRSEARKPSIYGTNSNVSSVPLNSLSQSEPSHEQPQNHPFYSRVADNVASVQAANNRYSSLESNQGPQRSGAINTSIFGTSNTVSPLHPGSSNETAITDKYGNFVKLLPKKTKAVGVVQQLLNSKTSDNVNNIDNSDYALSMSVSSPPNAKIGNESIYFKPKMTKSMLRNLNSKNSEQNSRYFQGFSAKNMDLKDRDYSTESIDTNVKTKQPMFNDEQVQGNLESNSRDDRYSMTNFSTTTGFNDVTQSSTIGDSANTKTSELDLNDNIWFSDPKYSVENSSRKSALKKTPLSNTILGSFPVFKNPNFLAKPVTLPLGKQTFSSNIIGMQRSYFRNPQPHKSLETLRNPLNKVLVSKLSSANNLPSSYLSDSSRNQGLRKMAALTYLRGQPAPDFITMYGHQSSEKNYQSAAPAMSNPLLYSQLNDTQIPLNNPSNLLLASAPSNSSLAGKSPYFVKSGITVYDEHTPDARPITNEIKKPKNMPSIKGYSSHKDGLNQERISGNKQVTSIQPQAQQWQQSYTDDIQSAASYNQPLLEIPSTVQPMNTQPSAIPLENYQAIVTQTASIPGFDPSASITEGLPTNFNQDPNGLNGLTNPTSYLTNQQSQIPMPSLPVINQAGNNFNSVPQPMNQNPGFMEPLNIKIQPPAGSKTNKADMANNQFVVTNQRTNTKIILPNQAKQIDGRFLVPNTSQQASRGSVLSQPPGLVYPVSTFTGLGQFQQGATAAANAHAQWTGTGQTTTGPGASVQGDSFKSYRPPLMPPLEHAQSNPEMNFFFSNDANAEGSRYKITADKMRNNYQNSPSKETSSILPPLNHNQLPPLRYTSDKYDEQGDARSKPPIYPYTIPPEGAQESQGYFSDGTNRGGLRQEYMPDDINDKYAKERQFPPGGNPYPIPLPPEGDQDDDNNPSEAVDGGIGKKNLIRPKPDLQCGSGWTGAWGDFGTFCYKVMYDKDTWDSARKNCKSSGGDLFSVTNAYEQRFLENFTNVESWLGYRDKSLAGTWSWSDGSKSVYTDWDSSAKDDHGKGRDCVVVDSKEGKWRDGSCSEKHSFLCKRNADDCGKGWKKLTLNSVRGCYKFIEHEKSWGDAQQTCLNAEGTLASILSDDEQTMVSQVYSKSDMWIGYNDKNNEGDWIWSDRMTSSYTNWDDKSPNNGGISCAIVTNKGKWHDEPCQTKYSYICKKPSPKSTKDLRNDGVLTQQVESFIANNTLIPDIDTSVSIFGRKSVAPLYFWTAQKIYNNHIHGTNFIAVHGHIKSVDGGLQLNGVDSWLDAGDFYGQCLGDPDLCIKGFSFGMQLNFDDDAQSYKDKRYVLDSAGNSRGVSVYVQNNTLYYKVVTSSKEWKLSTELVANEWQDLVLTWKKEEGLMLYVNGAFRDSQKEGTTTAAVPNKQARLTIGRKSGNPPYRYTRMYISSLYAFTRFLAPEDVPYVFTYDDTVAARYTWLFPKLLDGKVSGSPDIEVHGPVKAVDGGVYVDGTKAFLKVGDFNNRCISDPTKCPHGVSLSCKLKFNRVVRLYKERRYIMDTGGHESGTKGLAAYLVNNNLYFTLAMSTPEDTLRWTVRTSIFTVRWQRVVLTWSLQKGLWLYIDGQFRGWTKTPKTVPRDVVDESSEFIIGRKNVGEETKPAEFSIGSLAIFSRFLDKKAVSKVFGGKKMPYPGMIREVWKELPGKDISKLKEDPYYPNDPSIVEIIENFDAPFDVEKDYGSRVKGYFVAPETGNYTFYLSGSKSTELWLSSGESQQNMSQMISLSDETGHNQWNKFTAQISKTVNLEAGKYYYITALEKGVESTDSLSAGIRLPSGRFMRPISKEILQWRLPGDPFAGVVREVWQDIPGYKITDLTSNPNFPNKPSSIEVLDKFDAPHNVDDNYGTRIRGFFKAPENGQYRFFLAADTTGELWLSTDETERNLKKVVNMNGWTDHNEWLKFPEQKSERVHLKKGRYYYLEVYHKAEKLADCASVAVEFPSGHFEGPIKRVHLSWRLPDGKTGPGPSTEEEAIPKPVGLFPLTKSYGGKDASGNNDDGILSNVSPDMGPDGSDGGAYKFLGTANSYIEIPNKKSKLDTKNSITILANVFPTGRGGPILNYRTDGWGVHLWQFEETELFVRFVHRNGVFHKPIGARVIELNTWNQVGATYDNSTGVAQIWHNGKMVKSRNVGQIKLATQYDIRVGARDGDDRRFAGKIACIQIYDKSLDQQQIGNLKTCPVKSSADVDEFADDSSSGSGSGNWDSPAVIVDNTAVVISHEAGKYDKDEEADDLIQGSEFTTGKKCDPTPCENAGKCLKDAKRLDGYRCKCTSDFTGRNCQVSKPDAENPVVKRTKIPRAEKKEGNEKYQRNSTSGGIIEQLREEKKEEVLLLFQKLGCYRDQTSRHDMKNKVLIKSVSQEGCARACALEEKGFSYFGLQNSNECYCGHTYGRYGKAAETKCDKPCQGNSDENCGGDSTNMVYFFGMGTNYTVKAFTGEKDGADTDAKVYITLYGDKGDSGFRKLNAKKFVQEKPDSETMLLPELGQLTKIRILHDNSGSSPSWFLDKITVTDENGKVYSFPCKEWLSETQGGGKTERLLHVDTSSLS